MKLILASASTARAAMLRAAGVAFEIEPAVIDEEAIKQQHRRAGDNAMACALTLAEAKAYAVARRRNDDSLVLGADQILVAGDAWFDKPGDLDQAAAQLRSLRGRDHGLATVACAVRYGRRVCRRAPCRN